MSFCFKAFAYKRHGVFCLNHRRQRLRTPAPGPTPLGVAIAINMWRRCDAILQNARADIFAKVLHRSVRLFNRYLSS